MEDPTPFIMIGMLMGCGATLLIQAYLRRRTKKALARKQGEALATARIIERTSETADMARRLAVLEQIITDRPAMLADEIERLRSPAR